jgi:putative membrane protein
MKLSVLLLSAALLAVPTIALADSPRDFLNKALQADNSEIMLGQLAQARAANSGVRDYGRMLQNDHAQARNDVLNAGRRLGVRPNNDSSWDAKHERDKLQGMRADQFDKEFIHYMVDDHRKALNDFRDESRERHGAVSDLAKRQMPTLQKHLDQAVALADRLEHDHGPAYSDRDRDHNNGYGFRGH